MVINRYGIEALLIAGVVVSDGHPEDGMEKYYWTNMMMDMVHKL